MFDITLREKMTSFVTLTVQSFKRGCVIATKLGALVSPAGAGAILELYRLPPL